MTVEAPPDGELRDLDAIRDWVNGMALPKALRIECVEISPGRGIFRMDPPEAWRNPDGSVAGAAYLAATDYAAGMASLSVTGTADYVSTVDLGLHFLRPAMETPLMIASTVLRTGSRLAFIQTEVADASGVVIASGVGSFSVARGRGVKYPISPPD